MDLRRLDAEVVEPEGEEANADMEEFAGDFVFVDEVAPVFVDRN